MYHKLHNIMANKLQKEKEKASKKGEKTSKKEDKDKPDQEDFLNYLQNEEEGHQ